jgi:beta-glucosidase
VSESIKKSDVLSSLTFFEKVALLSGQNTWQTRSIPRLDIRPLFMADGPHGVRKQVGSSDHLGINASQPATCFPTAATIANSWDPELGEQIGAALGREAANLGVDVLLGPGLNIKRSPLCGRNFEYFSEDPYLTGKFGAAYVRGIQSAGIAACPKHFAVNSQETRRMTSNSVVDSATLREIYLTAFEMVTKEASPLTIMSSYNLINGTYANEHPELLQSILRDDWGFSGAVITDWGGGNDPHAAIEAGGTIEMPSPGFDSVQQVFDSKSTNLEKLDERVGELVDLVRTINPVPGDPDFQDAHHALAQRAAEESIVLLKNESSLLPLSTTESVAVIGQFAFKPRYQGAGSSLVNPTRLDTPIEALTSSSLNVVAQAQGFEHGKAADSGLIAQAVQAAQTAHTVLLYLGLDEIAESEGKDREHMRLPENQIALLRAVAAVNPRVVVVLAAGSAIEMPWLDECQAVLHGYLGGQAGAFAMVRALSGAINPSGRLSETYPLSLADTPTASTFPAQTRNALYKEGPFVGYRYYATTGTPVLFPFGFGLSYSQFEYSNLSVTRDAATFTVTNVGSVHGADVPQLYVRVPEDARKLGPMPTLELKGFRKITLDPGEKKTVTINFDEYSFRKFDAASQKWITVAGDYVVCVGHNANDIALHSTVRVAGQSVTATHPAGEVPGYATGHVQELSDQDFAVLLGRSLPVDVSARQLLGINSPLSDLQYAKSPVGRAIYRHYLARGLRKAEESGTPDLNLLFQYGMPFRAIAKMSGGLADMRMVEGILTIVNGHFFRGLGQVVTRFFGNRRRQKALQREFTALSTTHQSIPATHK